MNKECERCKEEREEYLNGWKRARADLINYKREEGERLARVQTAGKEMVVKELMPVLRSFEEGLAHADDGMKRIYEQLIAALTRQGVEEVAPEKGTPFDPLHHEAAGELEEDAPEGTVARLERKGYRMGEKNIQAAQVLIAKVRAEKKSE